MRHAYKILMGNSEKKLLIGTLRYIGENIIKIDLKNGTAV
jgi:hypothetical protein